MKNSFLSLVLLLTVLFASGKSFAQGCSVCTKTASELDNRSARGLNMGIIYLALLPLAAMGTIGVIWYKRNRAPVGE